MTDEEAKARLKKKEDHRSRVNDYYFVVFPVMFLIFNLIYWPTCLSKSASQGWPDEGLGSPPPPTPVEIEKWKQTADSDISI